MGIKGIYAEIGQGTRISLSKLAIESIESKGRPLKIAIDISIWQFQNQAGKGGSNPALRTLYYRLLRLLSTSIQPLFVFDGPNKPPMKRNKRTGIGGPSMTDSNTKGLLRLFGFPFHIAPGEAEAECALLQREAIVDAVLSEDVDTLMFGCGRTFRNWSSEESKGNQTPTHVSVYDARDIWERRPGLDREGMVLVALMSGGDYNTAGIPQCGIKVACEAARAGFGRSLCRILRSDDASMGKWRADLTHELQTNEKRHFRVKHKSLKISNTFPDREVLGFYTHPVVSSKEKIAKLKDCIKWDDVDISGLRAFVASEFDWVGLSGRHKFIRGLAPALLPERLRKGQILTASRLDDATLNSGAGLEIVRSICGQRNHFSTDGMLELRLSYYPLDILGLDFSTEVDDHEDYGRDGLAPLSSHGEILAYESEEEDHDNAKCDSASSTKPNVSRYDPTALQRAWLPETIAKIGVPRIVEDYEESRRNAQKRGKAKIAVRTTATKGGMPKGALERYITIKKPGLDSQNAKMSRIPERLSSDVLGCPSSLALNLIPNSPSPLQETRPTCNIIKSRNIILTKEQKPTISQKFAEPRRIAKKRSTASGNPWTNAQTSPNVDYNLPRFRVQVSKPVATSDRSLAALLSQKCLKDPKQLQGGIDRPPLSTSVRRKHSRSVTPPSSLPAPLGSAKHSLPTGPSSYQGVHVISSPEVGSDLSSLTYFPSKPSKIYNMPVTPDLIQHTKQSAPNEPIYLSSPLSAACTPLSPANEGLETLEFPKMKPFEMGIEKARCRKRFVTLRSSLEGAWKEVSDGEGIQAYEEGTSRAWRVSAVEVVDMTSDQVALERMQ